jgi:hypothetical protein
MQVIMDESIPIYRYSPIAADKDIRVLRLEPAATFTDPLVASFFVRKLNDTDDPIHHMPTYHCVSYCWGTLHDMTWMMCDHQRLELRENVDVMLRHLRKSTSPRNLWIDALCINQTDNIEKCAQVKAMGAIYERADKTHVWLGPAVVEDQISSVFAVLKDYALTTEKSPPINLGALSQLVTPLNAFLTRPWFTRRWVLQEVKLAHSVIVQCGNERLSWTWLQDGINKLLQDHAARSIHYLAIGLVPSDMTGIVDSLWALGARKQSKQHIFQLLWDHHTSVCVDERDRLFALYGMLGKDKIMPVILGVRFDPREHSAVDYSSHFSHVYTQMALAAIDHGLSRVIFSHALVFGNLAQQHPEWPSWVPSWNLTRKTRTPIGIGRFTWATMQPERHGKMLHLQGEIYPIVTVQDTTSTEGTIPFLRDTMRMDSFVESPVQSISTVIEMLIDSVGIHKHCYDCVETRPEEALLPEGYVDHGGNTPSWDVDIDTHLRKALRSESGLDHDYPGPKHYFPEALQQELDRMTQRHNPFRYQIGKRYVSGVAFAAVEPGDFVYRPCHGHVDSEFWDPYALVIRRHRPSASLEYHENNTFRLIGWCMPGWADLHKPVTIEDTRTVKKAEDIFIA